MRTWPHAPSRLVTEPGVYMVTSGTLHKAKLFDTPEKLGLLHDLLLEFAESFGWEMHAWAVFANHYHFVGTSPEPDDSAGRLVATLHRRTSRDLNRIDGAQGRRVWYRTRPTRLTYERSYLARLAYVMWNPAKHGLAANPERYPWCSMSWFKREGHPPFVESVLSFDSSSVNVEDDY